MPAEQLPPAGELTAEAVAALLPRRPADGHKGTFGTLVAVAGSLDYAGAALLVCSAAVRAGAGLVALAVPRSLQPTVAGRVAEAVTFGLPETSTGDLSPSASAELIAARDPAALVVGPGIRESDGYGALIGLLLESEGAPTVVDGGALNLLAAREHWWQGSAREAVLTPHPGEFARLTGAAAGTGEADRHAGCAAAAARFGQVVVLKGARTIVCAPDGRASISPFANAALATAGTGDVLAGTIGALLAQAVPAYEAACLGVWLHGRAAERIGAEVGDSGLAASDLPREIARARRELATGAA